MLNPSSSSSLPKMILALQLQLLSLALSPVLSAAPPEEREKKKITCHRLIVFPGDRLHY